MLVTVDKLNGYRIIYHLGGTCTKAGEFALQADCGQFDFDYLHMEEEHIIWMPYAEYVKLEQLKLYQLSLMFPTLKGFLWDVEEKEDEEK